MFASVTTMLETTARANKMSVTYDNQFEGRKIDSLSRHVASLTLFKLKGLSGYPSWASSRVRHKVVLLQRRC